MEQLDTTDYESVPYEPYVPYFGRAAVEAESRRTMSLLKGDDTAAHISASELGEALAAVRQDLARWSAGNAGYGRRSAWKPTSPMSSHRAGRI